MRNNKKKAFLSCAVVAAIGLLAAPEAMASGSSTCLLTTPSIEVVPDSNLVPTPCYVSDPFSLSPSCSAGGEFTGIKYKNITGSSLNHVATLVTRNNEVVVPNSTQVIENCGGDPVTKLGKATCHADAVKINGVPAGAEFWVIVSGRVLPIETTIATKPTAYSSTIKCFPITGLGLNLPPAARVTETLTDGDCSSVDGCCSVEFTLDAVGGAVLSAKLTQASLDNGCVSPGMALDGTLDGKPAEALELLLDGESLGLGNFGNGYFHSGDTSCTTKIVGGKVYTYGKPCP